MRTFTSIAAIAALFSATQVLAVNSVAPSVSNRHLLVSCMTKQMSVNKTISYNEATKVCKDQLKPQAEALAATNATKPGTAH